jgi:hypothetical protein
MIYSLLLFTFAYAIKLKADPVFTLEAGLSIPFTFTLGQAGLKQNSRANSHKEAAHNNAQHDVVHPPVVQNVVHPPVVLDTIHVPVANQNETHHPETV